MHVEASARVQQLPHLAGRLVEALLGVGYCHTGRTPGARTEFELIGPCECVSMLPTRAPHARTPSRAPHTWSACIRRFQAPYASLVGALLYAACQHACSPGPHMTRTPDTSGFPEPDSRHL